MDHIELRSPQLRDFEEEYSPLAFSVVDRRYLSKPKVEPADAFAEVIKRRRSRRSFEELPEDTLSSILWFAAKVMESSSEQSGFMWSHRGAPSAGGRHPIHLLVGDLQNPNAGLAVYDAVGHVLCSIRLV